MDKSLLGHLDINSITKELRKDSLSVKNRLQSILYDAIFVDTLNGKFGYPLIPNERCGLWYLAPDKQQQTSYFKSTDGHTNQWLFSLRRLNFHLLPLIGQFGGIAVVDSTRKGKLIPDALLKTIPIWCAVLNTILFEGDEDNDIITELGVEADSVDAKFLVNLRNEYNWVMVPNSVVSASERDQISKRIHLFVEEVQKLGLITKEKLIENLGGIKKPLVPQWYFPGCKMHDNTNDEPFFFDYKDKAILQNPYFTIQCITASKKTNEQGGAKMTVRSSDNNEDIKLTSWYYVQGSADDHELWVTKDVCNGKLTPNFCWDYIFRQNGSPNTDIIDIDTSYIYDWMSDEELILRMNRIYDTYERNKVLSSNLDTLLDVTRVKNDTNDTGIIFGTINQNIKYNNILSSYINTIQLVVLSENFAVIEIPENPKIDILQFRIESSKKGSKKLRDLFPELVPKLKISELNTDKHLMILCDSGKDISAGVVLVLLCKYFDLNWSMIDTTPKINKDLVKQQFSRLLNVRKVNPSRNTLQSVNTFIM